MLYVSIFCPSESGVAELEDDEGLVDDAIRHGAIHFLRQNVVTSEHFHQEVEECFYISFYPC